MALNVVILGAGFGGLRVASELDKALAGDKLNRFVVNVTLVTLAAQKKFIIGAANQFVFTGEQTEEEITRSYDRLIPFKHVKVVFADSTSIDAAATTVTYTQNNATVNLVYQRLVVATGTTVNYNNRPGLDTTLKMSNVADVQEFAAKLKTLKQGRVGVFSTLPHTCPPAPYEYMFLVDQLLTARGVRDQFELFVVTEKPKAPPGFNSAPMTAELKAKNIELVKSTTVVGVDHKTQNLTVCASSVADKNDTAQQKSLPYDLILHMPAVQGVATIQDCKGLPLTKHGLIKTHYYTYRTTTPGVYAIGDGCHTMIPLELPAKPKPLPKSGSFAILQANTVAKDIVMSVTHELSLWDPELGAICDESMTCWPEIGNGATLTITASLYDDSIPLIKENFTKLFDVQKDPQGLKVKQQWVKDNYDAYFTQ